MGTTAHHEAMQKHLEACLENTPGYASLIRKTRERIYSGFYPEHIISAVFQSYNGRMSTLDIHCFILIWSKIHSGLIFKIMIPVGLEPHGDRLIAQNQKILDDGLPDIFSALVTCERGRSADSDGNLRWNVTISAEKWEEDSISGEILRAFVDIEPGFAALEIGSTVASKTVWHLYSGSPLARWAYGSKNILLMIPNRNIRENKNLTCAK